MAIASAREAPDIEEICAWRETGTDRDGKHIPANVGKELTTSHHTEVKKTNTE